MAKVITINSLSGLDCGCAATAQPRRYGIAGVKKAEKKKCRVPVVRKVKDCNSRTGKCVVRTIRTYKIVACKKKAKKGRK